MTRLKLESAIKNIDAILCNLKLSRPDHDIVFHEFKVIVDLANIGIDHKESNDEISRLVQEDIKNK